MAIFGRTKPREGDGPTAPATGTPPPPPPLSITPHRDTGDLGVPPIRPAQHETPTMTLAPKPNAMPSAPTQPARAPTAPVGVPARPPRAETAERRTLVVGRGISLQGTVSDAERLVVEGTVESQMIQAAELMIAQSGVFRGEVQVEDAEIAGLFDGTLTVRGSLTIRGTGKVNGIARYRKLTVEEGGVVSGRMEAITEGNGAGGAASSPPPAMPRASVPHDPAGAEA